MGDGRNVRWQMRRVDLQPRVTEKRCSRVGRFKRRMIPSLIAALSLGIGGGDGKQMSQASCEVWRGRE